MTMYARWHMPNIDLFRGSVLQVLRSPSAPILQLPQEEVWPLQRGEP
jgi:hypothetical protein